MEEGCTIDGKFHNLEVENLLTTGEFALSDKLRLGELQLDSNITVGNNATINNKLIVDTKTLVVDPINNNVGIGVLTPISTLKLDVDGNVKIRGDLEVIGTTTLAVEENTTISGPLQELGTGTTGIPSNDMGIVMERGDQPNAFMGWDESEDKFIMGIGSITSLSSGNLTITQKDLQVSGIVATNLTGTLQTTEQPNIKTVGTIETGIWQGTAIADSYISSASTWNDKQEALEFGINNGNVIKCGNGISDNDFLRINGTTLEGLSASQIKSELNLVDNTTLSSWIGSTSITTLGTISTGTWNGTTIAIEKGGTGATTESEAASALGLGTEDTPQFTAINLGHASDTTIARASAGVVTIEGEEIRTGIIPVNKGGTGEIDYDDGQLLIGNSSTRGLTKRALHAGSGINITNGNGYISISAPINSSSFTGLTDTPNEYTNHSKKIIQVNSTSDGIEFSNSPEFTGISIVNDISGQDVDSAIGFCVNGTNNQFTIGVDDGDGDKFKIGTTEIDQFTRLTIDSSGKVGIGNSSPQYALDVNGDINISSGSTFRIDGNVDAIFSNWTEDGSDIYRSSNVGIGTTSPNNLLHLQSTITPQLKIGYNNTNFSTISVDSNSNITFTTAQNGVINFSDNINANAGLNVLGGNIRLTGSSDTLSLSINNTNSSNDSVIKFQSNGTDQFTMGVDRSDNDNKFKIGTSAIDSNTRLTIDSSGNTALSGNLSVTGTITLGSTTITSDEIGVLDGVNKGTALANKAVVLDNGKSIDSLGTIGCGAITSSGDLSVNGAITCTTSLTLDSTTINSNEIEVLENVVPGIAAANKAVVLDSNSNISGLGSITSSGDLSVTGTITGDTSLTLDTTTITTNNLSILSPSLKGNDSIYIGSIPSSTSNAEKNVALGINSLTSITLGDFNTALGYQALYTNLIGTGNTATGYEALYNSTGDGSTATGYEALKNNTGDYNTAFGYKAGDNITGGNYNVCIGFQADPPSANSNTHLVIGSTTNGNDTVNWISGDSFGNVGIGTNNPGQKLQVEGNIRIYGGDEGKGAQLDFGDNNRILKYTTNDTMTLQSPGDVTIIIDNNNNNSSNYFNIKKDTTDADSGGTELFRVQENGNVGINTNLPEYKLDIAGTIRIMPTISNIEGTAIRVGPTGSGNNITLIRVDKSDGESNMGSQNNYGFSIKYMGERDGNFNSLSIFSDDAANTDNAIEAMTILQDGNIGIKTTDPEVPLHISNVAVRTSTPIELLRLGLTDGSQNTGSPNQLSGSGTLIGFTNQKDSPIGNSTIYHMATISGEKDNDDDNKAAGRLVFKINSDTFVDDSRGNLVEAMRINSSGNVGIGTINPPNTLTVNGSSTDTTSILGLRSGNSAVTFNDGAQIAFGFNGNDKWQHFIHTRHSYANSNNAIDFYVCNGTEHNSVTSGSIHTMSLVSGNVGINTTSPDALLQIDQSDADDAIRFVPENNGLTWRLYADNNNKFWIYLNNGGTKGGYVDGTVNEQQLTFTGQHRCILNKNINETSKGLIVSSSGKYINLDNSLNTNINESLPICTITNIDNDIKVFGVISDKEDTNDSRIYNAGSFVTPYEKTNKNEQRMFINSLGEGAVWVCNKNGVLVNGDYISSSSVTGYGMKQITNKLLNSTVAKITCNCEFSLTKIVKQKLKVITTTETYEENVTQDVEKTNTETKIEYDTTLSRYVKKEVTTTTTKKEKLYDTVDLYNEAGEIIGTHEIERKETKTKTIRNIDYDANGNVQYEDDLDADGNQQMIYPLETRFLQADATQITESEYNTKLAAGEQVYIACFVGCTYHCG